MGIPGYGGGFGESSFDLSGMFRVQTSTWISGGRYVNVEAVLLVCRILNS